MSTQQPETTKQKEQTKTPEPEQAAPQPKVLSAEERRQLYDKLRLRMSTSKLAVTAPPGMQAYWARKNDDSEMARLDYLGFRKVIEINGQPKRYKAQGLREDGTYVMGDVILMEISSDEYNFYVEENSRKASEMARSAKEKFVEDAEKQGAPTFTVKRKA